MEKLNKILLFCVEKFKAAMVFDWNWHVSSSAEYLCKQIEPLDQVRQSVGAWSGSKLFDTLMVFLKEYFEKKLLLKKNPGDNKKNRWNYQIYMRKELTLCILIGLGKHKFSA